MFLFGQIPSGALPERSWPQFSLVGVITIPIPSIFAGFAGGPVPPWPQDNKRAIVIRVRPSWSHFITTSVIDLNDKDWKFSIKIIREQVAETTPRVSITLQEKDDVKVRVV
jgi:hypothetical protein